MARSTRVPVAPTVFPPLAILYVAVAPLIVPEAASPTAPISFALSAAMIVVMIGAIFAAVHHAEVVAHRTGEPLGTLVLTLSVTVIEVTLITSMMVAPDPDPALARDTVFSVVIIVCNGLVGLCILIGGFKYREQEFQVSGTGVYLNIIGTLSVLTLVLPNYTLSVPGPFYSKTQVAFVGVVTVVLYAVFLFVQTVRHTDYFLAADAAPIEAPRPAARTVVMSLVLLIAALAGVILIAKKFAGVLKMALDHAGAPPAVAGVILALLVLTPESVTAVKAARRDRLQQSLNLALGSSLATIGLTVPAIAVIALGLGRQMTLGLDPADTMLLALTLFTSVLTFGTGRTNILSGLIHLVLFATFLFLLFVP